MQRQELEASFRKERAALAEKAVSVKEEAAREKASLLDDLNMQFREKEIALQEGEERRIRELSSKFEEEKKAALEQLCKKKDDQRVRGTKCYYSVIRLEGKFVSYYPGLT